MSSPQAMLASNAQGVSTTDGTDIRALTKHSKTEKRQSGAWLGCALNELRHFWATGLIKPLTGGFLQDLLRMWMQPEYSYFLK